MSCTIALCKWAAAATPPNSVFTLLAPWHVKMTPNRNTEGQTKKWSLLTNHQTFNLWRIKQIWRTFISSLIKLWGFTAAQCAMMWRQAAEISTIIRQKEKKILQMQLFLKICIWEVREQTLLSIRKNKLPFWAGIVSNIASQGFPLNIISLVGHQAFLQPPPG